jgi:hypothetical protein
MQRHTTLLSHRLSFVQDGNLGIMWRGFVMKLLFAAGLLVLLLNSNEATAEAVSLVCKGTFYNYEATTVKSTVGPASASLDI